MGLTREEAKSKASIRIQLFDAKGANKTYRPNLQLQRSTA